MRLVSILHRQFSSGEWKPTLVAKVHRSNCRWSISAPCAVRDPTGESRTWPSMPLVNARTNKAIHDYSDYRIKPWRSGNDKCNHDVCLYKPDPLIPIYSCCRVRACVQQFQRQRKVIHGKGPTLKYGKWKTLLKSCACTPSLKCACNLTHAFSIKLKRTTMTMPNQCQKQGDLSEPTSTVQELHHVLRSLGEWPQVPSQTNKWWSYKKTSKP